ncbi:hypothetical protein V2J09_023638 [Rumex salicifolius]
MAKFVLPYETPILTSLYTLGEPLSETTHLCLDKSTGEDYACKSIAKTNTDRPDDDVLREIHILHRVSKIPTAVAFLDAYEDSDHVHLVTELCDGGDLFDRVLANDRYSERDAVRLMRTIVEFIQSCHSLGVMHRDLNPDNLIFKNGDDDSPLKVADFGFAVFFRRGDTFKDRVGSPLYTAPEVLKNKYGPEADVWSAGVILYILLTGIPPFWADSNKEIFRKILKEPVNLEPQLWEEISDDAKDLVCKMLEKDPKKRLPAYYVLSHPWMTDESNVPNQPLDSVISRLGHFSLVNNLKRMKSTSISASKPNSVLPYETPIVTSLYTLGDKLGQGQYGTTYRCFDKSTGEHYACKSISKHKLVFSDDYDDVWREIQIMHHVSSIPSVVSIRGAYEDSKHIHLVMELCEGGELFDRIIKKGSYSEREAAKLMNTIVRFVESCHSLGVMHRDLKPENFLFKSTDDDSPLKVIDFGLSVFFYPGDTFTGTVGSPYYVAPEVLKKSYGPEADVWSVGIILYILLTGVPPFWAETTKGIFRKVLKGTLDLECRECANISENGKDLIMKMLEKDPQKRLSVYQVLCHPWMADESNVPDKPLDSLVLSRLKQFSAMNKLKKMACRVIAAKLSEEEIGGLKEMFKKIDADKSGAITFDELKQGLKRVDSKLLESEIEDLMTSADVDENGILDYSEFVAATLHLHKLEMEENLAQAFAYFDRDESGYITIDELRQACMDFGMNQLHLEEMMKEIDQNDDGQIDYGEFVAMMRKGEGGGIRRRSMRSLDFEDPMEIEDTLQD